MNMALLQTMILALVAVGGAGVVLTREPLKQAIAISFYGLLLTVFFLLLEAPDVALSQMVVGAVAQPLMLLLALARVRRTNEAKAQREKR